MPRRGENGREPRTNVQMPEYHVPVVFRCVVIFSHLDPLFRFLLHLIAGGQTFMKVGEGQKLTMAP